MANELVLANYGVQELQAVEKQEVEGGHPWYVLIGIGAAIGTLNEIIQDWDGFKAGFNGGKEPPR